MKAFAFDDIFFLKDDFAITIPYAMISTVRVTWLFVQWGQSTGQLSRQPAEIDRDSSSNWSTRRC